MKKMFETPSIEITKFMVEDVVTTGYPNVDEEQPGNGDFGGGRV